MTDSFIVTVSPPPAFPLLFWERSFCHLLFNLCRSIVSILHVARVRNKPRFLINVWRGELLPGKKKVKCQSVRMFFSRQAFGAHTRNRLPQWGRCFAEKTLYIVLQADFSPRCQQMFALAVSILLWLGLMAVCEHITSVYARPERSGFRFSRFLETSSVFKPSKQQTNNVMDVTTVCARM